MAADFPHPRVLKNQQNTQTTYELPHRVFTSSVYPVKSSNSSTVILYGHENGVRVVWRGGRPFKPAQPDYAAPKKTNGSDNAVMVLDSDDEGAAQGGFEDDVEFEDEEEELDPTRPFPDILQTLDLHFGTAAMHLALLPSTFLNSEAALSGDFLALKNKIVFTAACADNSLRLVTLPLTPPSPASKSRPEFQKRIFDLNAGNGSWGETVTILSGHQKPADGVSMTVNSGGNPTTLSRPESRYLASREPSIIVSSHSKEVTGLLLVFEVSLKPRLAQVEPLQKVFLPSPAVCISFNPSVSSSRSSQLLVAESRGVCRIYDYSLLSRTSEDSDSLAAKQGSWLLSLYAGFKSRKTEVLEGKSVGLSVSSERKSILDAKWVSGGRSVIVLLEDGEWAVWDIEGAAPGAPQGVLGRQGVKGGSKSEYSLKGYIESGMTPRPSGPSHSTASKFAPMTPGTRKTAEPFAAARGQQSGPIRGQLSVLELPTSMPTSPPDESILFRFGNTFALIPSLAKYWTTNPQGAGGLTSNPFAGTTGARMVRLEGIDLQGERCPGITQIPRAPTPNGLPSDIVVLGEHRLTIVFAGKPTTRQPQFRAAARPTLTEKSTNGSELEDIDRALALMENSGSRREIFG